MPDFVEVTVRPMTALPLDSAALLLNGTAVGKTSKVLACSPEPLSRWRARPAIGHDYVLEATPVGGGARMAFRVSCTSAASDEAEFEIAGKI